MAAPREPQDRKAPAKRAPRKRTTPAPAVEKTPVERLQAEAEALDADQWQERDLGDSGLTVRVQNFADWPRNVYHQVNAGNFEAIARVIHEGDLDTWLSWDCSVGQLIEFGLLLVAEGSEDVGEAVASRVSSRSTRRR